MRSTFQVIMLVIAGTASAQSLGPRAALIQPGVDSLAVFFVEGNDTTRTGTVRDEIAFLDLGGRRVLRRVYQTQDRILGTRIDTLIDDAASLSPVSHRSRTS